MAFNPETANLKQASILKYVLEIFSKESIHCKLLPLMYRD